MRPSPSQSAPLCKEGLWDGPLSEVPTAYSLLCISFKIPRHPHRVTAYLTVLLDEKNDKTKLGLQIRNTVKSNSDYCWLQHIVLISNPIDAMRQIMYPMQKKIIILGVKTSTNLRGNNRGFLCCDLGGKRRILEGGCCQALCRRKDWSPSLPLYSCSKNIYPLFPFVLNFDATNFA